MNLICFKKCFNANNEQYRILGLYRYYEEKFIDMNDKYYYIYEIVRTTVADIKTRREEKCGFGRIEFINDNFMNLRDYYLLIKEIDLQYETELFSHSE